MPLSIQISCISDSIGITQTPSKKTPPLETLYHYTRSSRSSALSIHHHLSNDAIALSWWCTQRCLVHWVSSPLRLIAALRLLQLVARLNVRIMSIITIIAIERRSCRLVWDRRAVGRSCGAAIVGLVGVVCARSAVLSSRRLVSAHPTGSVHWGHATTTATAAVVAREEESEDDEGGDNDS